MMDAVITLSILVGGFISGYYLLPWLINGVSPRETWRRDHDR